MNIHKSQVAKSIPFNNSTNGFTSTEVQSAIEEAKELAEGKARFFIPCSYKGACINKYLQFFKDAPSDEAPWVFAYDVTLDALAVAFKKLTSCEFEIYIDGVLVYTWELDGVLTANITGTGISVTAGSYMYIFCAPHGSPANSPDTPLLTIGGYLT